MRSTTLTTRTLSSGSQSRRRLHRGERFERRHVAGAGDARHPACRLRRCSPRSRCRRPALQCLIASSIDSHCGCGCLPATMTLTRLRLRRQWSVTLQQRVRIGRQIDADHLRRLVDHVIDEAGILVAEAVVILPPDMRGEQIVERRDRPPPGDVIAGLEPLRVLVEHRIDDVDEGLVAAEEAVAAGQQIPLEPALALVLAQHLEHAAVVRDDASRCRGCCALDMREVTSSTASQRFEVSSSGLKMRKLRVASVELHDVAQVARPGPASPRRSRAPGCSTAHGVLAEIGQPQLAQQHAAVRVRVVAHAALARRRERRAARVADGPRR